MTDIQLATLIDDSGEGWLRRIEPDEQSSLSTVRRLLESAYAVHAAHYPDPMPGDQPFSDESLLAEASVNPDKVRAVLQTLAAATPTMVTVAWRVVNGDTIAALDLHYCEDEQSFSMEVRLSDALYGRTTQFQTDQIEDATFLRHLGILRMGNRPLFDGYFPLTLTQPRPQTPPLHRAASPI